MADFENEWTIGRTIYMKDYPKVWPFKAPQAMVKCTDKYCVAITLNGKHYALNGSMQGKIPGMPTPFVHGVVKHDPILKNQFMSVGWVIDYGLDLWDEKKIITHELKPKNEGLLSKLFKKK